MKYVSETLLSGESIFHAGKFHWLYTFGSILYLVSGLLIGSFYISLSEPSVPESSILGFLGVLVILVGVAAAASRTLTKWTTEIAITNQRLIYKSGWIARKVEEVSIHRLEEVNFKQGVLGRIFGYGVLVCHGVGSGAIKLPTIGDPIRFRKAIEEARAGD